jgi:O-antigen ligase
MPDEQPLSSTSPRRVVYLRLPLRNIPIVFYSLFLLFIFTLPFENIDLSFIPGASSLARMAGLLFFACALLYPNISFRIPPRVFWWFVGYVLVFVLQGLLVPDVFFKEFVTRLITFFQLLILFWIASNILQEERLARGALYTFAIASILAAFAMILGLPGFVPVKGVLDGGRLTLSGFNPNNFSIILALAAVILIGLGLNKSAKFFWNRLLCPILTLPLLVAIVNTGSRIGVIAFILGTALYPLPYRRSKRKLTAIMWAILGLIGIGYLSFTNPTSLSRWTQTYQKGDTTRDRILAASVEMITEQPLLGWQPIVFWYELGSRLGREKRDAHNLVFHLLLEVGVIGTLPFLVGLYLCARGAWKGRTGNFGILPLALLVTIFVGNMAHTWLTRKPLWLVLALAAASAFIGRTSGRVILLPRVSRSFPAPPIQR